MRINPLMGTVKPQSNRPLYSNMEIGILAVELLLLLVLLSISQVHLLSSMHTVCLDDNADAKRILLAFPPADWRRQPGHLRIAWLSTVQQDRRHHHLTLPEAADLAQIHPLWSMMSTYSATQS